jgi:hypothetical protein
MNLVLLIVKQTVEYQRLFYVGLSLVISITSKQPSNDLSSRSRLNTRRKSSHKPYNISYHITVIILSNSF